MTETHRADTLWSAIHAERHALAVDLAGLDDDAWAVPSLCAAWTVEEVVAHLVAVASIGRWRWMGSIIAARFDADRHNRRQMLEHRGRTPAETLQRFRSILDLEIEPSGHTAAWLGEVIVHAEDIRRPLGLEAQPDIAAVTEVARFFAQRDFAVASKRTIRGLRLEATDGPFETGDGALVRGTTLALTMTMAGRRPYLSELTGPGVAVLEARGAGG